MNRQKKEEFKNNIKQFYISIIENKGYFDYCNRDFLFVDATYTFDISYRTARRYFWQLVPKEIITKYII